VRLAPGYGPHMRLRAHLGDALVVAIFVAALVDVALAQPAGNEVALYLFPAGWTLPLLLRRRWPLESALTVLGVLAIEGQVAYHGSELQEALVAAIRRSARGPPWRRSGPASRASCTT